MLKIHFSKGNIFMQIKEKFYTFSKYVACPYILALDAIKPHIYNLSFVLVGSAVTDICSPSSSVDIAILCSRDTYAKIDPYLERNNGKFTELSISGVKTRYYLETIEDIIEGMNRLDDQIYYLYASAEPRDDGSGAYKNLQKDIKDQDLIQKRKTHVYRSMVRRRRAVSAFLDSCKDPFGRLSICEETLKYVLRAIAVFDNVPFDPKKDTYRTSLAGTQGKILTPCVDELMECLTRILRPEDVQAQKNYLQLIDNCISAIS